jgi:hypothetical protein
MATRRAPDRAPRPRRTTAETAAQELTRLCYELKCRLHEWDMKAAAQADLAEQNRQLRLQNAQLLLLLTRRAGLADVLAARSCSEPAAAWTCSVLADLPLPAADVLADAPADVPADVPADMSASVSASVPADMSADVPANALAGVLANVPANVPAGKQTGKKEHEPGSDAGSEPGSDTECALESDAGSSDAGSDTGAWTDEFEEHPLLSEEQAEAVRRDLMDMCPDHCDDIFGDGIALLADFASGLDFARRKKTAPPAL